VRTIAALGGLGLGGLLSGCGASGPACDPVAHSGCDQDRVCEAVVGESQPACVLPFLVRGIVRDATAGTPVAGARVALYAADETPIATAATTAADGSYELRPHGPRAASHAPATQPMHLRVWAPGYGAYPHRWQAWPTIDAAAAHLTPAGDIYVLSTGDTDATLLAFAGGPGVGVLCGTVATAPGAKAPLVVAELESGAGVAATTDDTGAFRIFGIPPGHVQIQAYASGAVFDGRALDLNSGETQCRDLAPSSTPTVRVSGSIERPSSSSFLPTVALVVASTWNPSTSGGDVPPGLTATVGQDGSFAIPGVPPGRYVLVASLASDGLVQLDDPPVVVAASSDIVVPGKVRLADSLAVIEPGKQGPERVTTTPTMSWQDASAEAKYRLTVRDALGRVVFMRDEMAHHGDAPAVPFEGVLVPGMSYRFRAEALDDAGRLITRTEDLLGVFTFGP
jgi:hypothetical protein